jgi:2'-5' RNA ligase
MPRRAPSFAAAWDDFVRLSQTDDSLARARRGPRRWFLQPYVSFIIPIQDEAALARLTAWQTAFQPWLNYDPLPVEALHITLYDLGRLTRHPWLWLPHTWRRETLLHLADQIRATLEDRSPFEVEIGGLNAFSNALFAEIKDCDSCLRASRIRLRRALPLKARLPSPGPYLPHITLGYWGKQPAAPLIDAVRTYRQVEPLLLKVTHVKFTIYTPPTGTPERDFLRASHEEVLTEFQFKA